MEDRAARENNVPRRNPLFNPEGTTSHDVARKRPRLSLRSQNVGRDRIGWRNGEQIKKVACGGLQLNPQRVVVKRHDPEFFGGRPFALVKQLRSFDIK